MWSRAGPTPLPLSLSLSLSLSASLSPSTAPVCCLSWCLDVSVFWYGRRSHSPPTARSFAPAAVRIHSNTFKTARHHHNCTLRGFVHAICCWPRLGASACPRSLWQLYAWQLYACTSGVTLFSTSGYLFINCVTRVGIINRRPAITIDPPLLCKFRDSGKSYRLSIS
jgi:hypothetical protein